MDLLSSAPATSQTRSTSANIGDGGMMLGMIADEPDKPGGPDGYPRTGDELDRDRTHVSRYRSCPATVSTPGELAEHLRGVLTVPPLRALCTAVPADQCGTWHITFCVGLLAGRPVRARAPVWSRGFHVTFGCGVRRYSRHNWAASSSLLCPLIDVESAALDEHGPALPPVALPVIQQRNHPPGLRGALPPGREVW